MERKFLAGAFFGLGLFLLVISSCNKPSTNPPVISFSNAVGYIYEDTTLYRGTNFTIWVYATKNGGDDLVESGKISRSINGGPDSTIQTMSFVTTKFSQYYSYNAADSGTAVRYTFTFGNQNGLTSTASIKVTGF